MISVLLPEMMARTDWRSGGSRDVQVLIRLLYFMLRVGWLLVRRYGAEI